MARSLGCIEADFARKYSLERSWRDLQDFHAFAPLRPQCFRIFSSNFFAFFDKNLQKFVILEFFSLIFAQILMNFCRNFADNLENVEILNKLIFRNIWIFKRKFLNFERILTVVRLAPSVQFVSLFFPFVRPLLVFWVECCFVEVVLFATVLFVVFFGFQEFWNEKRLEKKMCGSKTKITQENSGKLRKTRHNSTKLEKTRKP